MVVCDGSVSGAAVRGKPIEVRTDAGAETIGAPRVDGDQKNIRGSRVRQLRSPAGHAQNRHGQWQMANGYG